LNADHQLAMTLSQYINKCFLKLTAEECYRNKCNNLTNGSVVKLGLLRIVINIY